MRSALVTLDSQGMPASVLGEDDQTETMDHKRWTGEWRTFGMKPWLRRPRVEP